MTPPPPSPARARSGAAPLPLTVALSALSLLVIVLLGGPTVAVAAEAPAPTAALSTVIVSSDGTLSGSLTVPGVLDGGASSLTASIGSTPIPVSAQVVAPSARGVMLVLDTSTAAGSPGLDAIRAAVDAYLSAAPRDLLVGVIGYDASARLAIAPTLDRNAVRAAAGALVARLGRTTYDALSMALTQLGADGQRTVLLVTGGADLGSAATLEQVTTGLRTAGVTTRVVSYQGHPANLGPLAQVATDGAAGVVPAGDAAALVSTLTATARTVTTQVRWSLRTSDAQYGSQQVVLSGASGGTRFAASAPVDLGAAPVVTNAPPAALATPAPSLVLGLPLTAVLALVAVGLALAAVVVALTAPAFSSRGSVRAREISQAFDALPDERSRPGAFAETVVAFGDRMMRDRQSTGTTVTLIERADLPFRAGEWWVVRVLSVLVCGALGGLLLSRVLVAGIVVGVVLGLLAPGLVLRRLADRRSEAFDQQLPDVLTLMASSLQTGFSFLQALDAVSRDAAQPAAKEFSRTMAETRIGADVDEALGRLGGRMRSGNMEITAMAVRIQRQVGGNLSETLRTTAATIRERQALARHVRGLAAEGRLSTWILALLPIVIFLATLFLNYDYISVLWNSLIGAGMLVYAVSSLTLGVFLMGRMAKVEI
ncbi:type II secretion system F family protein [Dermatophilaceae bacterium Soc4.6]